METSTRQESVALLKQGKQRIRNTEEAFPDGWIFSPITDTKGYDKLSVPTKRTRRGAPIKPHNKKTPGRKSKAEQSLSSSEDSAMEVMPNTSENENGSRLIIKELEEESILHLESISDKKKIMKVKPADHRSIEQWVMDHYKIKGKTEGEVRSDVLSFTNEMVARGILSEKRALKRRNTKEVNQKNKDTERKQSMKKYYSYEEEDKVSQLDPRDEKTMQFIYQQEMIRNRLYRDAVTELLSKAKDLALSNPEEVNAEYCTRYLREPDLDNNERACKKGEKCICLIMAGFQPDGCERALSDNGFICKEFLTPSQEQKYIINEEKYPKEQFLCLPDLRLTTNFRWNQNVKENIIPKESIQNHCYKVDVPGGYRSEKCISPLENSHWGITHHFLKWSTSDYNYNTFTPEGEDRVFKCLVEQNLCFR